MSSRRGYLPVMGTIPTDYDLCWDFNGDYLDKSPNALHGIKTGTASFVAGSKPGKQCLEFTNGCVRTPFNLPVSDKFTISFGIKTLHGADAIIAELSANYNSNNAFLIQYRRDANLFGYIQFNSHKTNYDGFALVKKINTGGWFHVVVMYDRNDFIKSTGLVDAKIVKQNVAQQDIQSGNYTGNPLFVGQRNASSLPFVGNLQNFKYYRRILNINEILGLRSEIL